MTVALKTFYEIIFKIVFEKRVIKHFITFQRKNKKIIKYINFIITNLQILLFYIDKTI